MVPARPEPVEGGAGSGEARFAAATALAYLVVAAAGAAVHEPWRDELQAWLIARDASGPLALLRNLRYEGHPGLWHALLWPLTRLGGPALAQAAAVAVGTATAYVFARWAPFPRPIRALFPFGSLQLWDWGVVARSYGLGVLLLLVAAALAARRERHPLALGAALALAANASVHAAIVAASLLVVLVVERAAPWRDPRRAAPAGAFWGGVALGGGGLVACALQAWPPGDSAVGAIWLQRPVRERLEIAVAAPVHGLTFASWPDALGRAELPLIAVAVAIAAALVAAAWSSLARRRAAWIAAALPAVTLLALFYDRYYGGPRHAGFLLVALVVALWIAPTFPPRPARAASRPARLPAWRRLDVALAAALAWGVLGAAVVGAREVTGVCSAARATAELIRRQGLDGLPLVGDPDSSAAGVVALLGAPSAFYENVERRGSFAVWDARHAPGQPGAVHAADAAVFARARQLAGPRGAVAVIDREASPLAVAAAGARLVGARRADLHREESFWVYLVPPPAGAR